MSAANNVDVKRTPHCVHADLSSAKFHSIARTEINAAFPDPVCRSRSGLRHQENDHVDQDCSGSRVRVRRHPGRTGVCRSPDLRVQHVSIRQLRRHRWSLLSLSDERATSAAPSDDGRLHAGHHLRCAERKLAGAVCCHWPP
jgi:hypothetical protein